MIENEKIILCEYCKKIIYKDEECFETHDKKYYHADWIKKEKN